MNKSTFSLLALSCGSLIADESPMEITAPYMPATIIYERAIVSHNFTPRIFFKNHKEGGYNYNMFGLTVGYHYKKNEGINFKASVSTNLDGAKPYVEEDISFSYAMTGTSYLSFAPYLASKNATHQIKKVDEFKYIVTKGSLYMGVGLKPETINNLETEIKIGLSRDLYNILLHSSDEKFIGRKFSNPFGFICEISLAYKMVDQFTLAVDGLFARGFKNEFRSFGGGLTANWKF